MPQIIHNLYKQVFQWDFIFEYLKETFFCENNFFVSAFPWK